MKHTSSCFTLLIASLLFLKLSTAGAQVSMGFENLTTTQNCTSVACNYTDPLDPAVPHNLPDVGGIPVNSSSSITEIGFTSSFVPTRTGGSATGLTDGDFFGYAAAATVNSNVGQNPIEGSQAFIAEDTDGEAVITFDPVSLVGASSPMFTMNYIVDGTFELTDGANDRFYIGLEITGCGSAITLDLLDATGTGAGSSTNMNDITDKTWFPLSQDLSAYIGCQVVLVVKIDLNSSTEEVAFDNIVFSAGSLPVDLVHFTATPNQRTVDLEWSTASEINNDRFEIEESVNGRTFRKIGEQKGQGTVITSQDYTYTVRNPKNGTSYFRLKQIDFDGKYEYSNIVNVRINSQSTEIGQIYPNPSSSGLVNMSYLSITEEEAGVYIYDITGKLFFRKTMVISKGENLLEWDFSSLPAGAYVLTINTPTNQVNRKLIIE